MSLARCIPQLLAQGKLTPAQAQTAQALYGARVRHHARSMGAAAAAGLASQQTAQALLAAARRKRRLQVLQIDAQKRALASMASYDGGAAGPVSGRAAQALIDRDGLAPYSNVEARRKAIKARAHAEMDRILGDHRRTLTGQLRNRAQMDEIGRELFNPGSTGNPAAAAMADAWTRAAEALRLRFNAAGGNIGKLSRWGLPQSHDSLAVRRAGWQAWRDEIWPRLDRTRMIDEATGIPFDDPTLEAVLRDVFETIRTDGFNKLNPGGTNGARSLANRRADHRFLHFNSYDDWAAYQARFGSGTAFDAMMGHVEAMSRDIAAMEILGPNPNATVRWLGDSIEKHAALHGDAAGRDSDRAYAGRSVLERLWNEYTGALRRPESRAIALTFGAVKGVQTSAKLGGAMLSAVPTDPMFQIAARRFNGLPVASMIGDYARLLARDGDRRFAVRRGLIAEEWANMTAASNRTLGEEVTAEWASRLAEGTLRLSGLTAWTQAGRWAFGMEFLDTLQGQFGKALGDVPPELRGALERYGVSAADWDAIRQTPLRTERGQDWFFPQDVPDQRLGDRLLEMIASETDHAVPVADLRTRALINDKLTRGTLFGEAVRSMFLFKSFGISVLLSHGRRALERPSWPGRIGYAASLVIPLTIGGAIALQLKALAGGQDPRPMDTAEFWGAAVLQGGGFGIFGDFLGASENRFGGGWGATLGGPLVQAGQNLADLTAGNAMKALRGDETDVGRDVVRLVDQELPFQSLWYARTAFDRMVTDQLQTLLDPNYRESWRRMDRRLQRQGQDLWWERGEMLPDRAPDFSNILDGAER